MTDIKSENRGSVMARFEMKSAPARKGQSFIFDDIRITVITKRIIRIEKSADRAFCDKATQLVLHRNFQTVKAFCERKGDVVSLNAGGIEYRIDLLTLEADVRLNGQWESPSNATNLGGTARTLDGTFGILGGWKGKKEKTDHFCLGHIRKGVFASNGVAEIDDSKSFLFNEDGSI